MKYFVIISTTALLLLTSCVVNKIENFSDDVYANPAIERAKEAAYKKHYNDSVANERLAQKAKDDANPNYQEREFKYDDYYDYEYATRVKRFENPISGLGYYDNYYTNSYWYNQNPYNYGVSVYNGYPWWGNSYNNYNYNPSINFYSNYGWSCNNNYGYNGYNPYMLGYSSGFGYGYNLGYNNSYFGMPYGNQFGYGYNPYGYNPYGYNSWNNGFGNNGWGYYNGYDHNSSYTYGPRSSHGGSNDRKSSNAGMRTEDDSYYNRFANSMVNQQEQAVKFSPERTPRKNNEFNNDTKSPRNINSNSQSNEIKRDDNSIRNSENPKPIRGINIQNEPKRDNKNFSTDPEPVREKPIRILNDGQRYQPSDRQQVTPSNNGSRSQPSGNGGARPR